MTDPKKATLFAIAMVLLAILAFFMIVDWSLSLSTFDNTLIGHVTLFGLGLPYVWFPALAAVAICWAVYLNLG